MLDCSLNNVGQRMGGWDQVSGLLASPSSHNVFDRLGPMGVHELVKWGWLGEMGFVVIWLEIGEGVVRMVVVGCREYSSPCWKGI